MVEEYLSGKIVTLQYPTLHHEISEKKFTSTFWTAFQTKSDDHSSGFQY